MKGSARSRVGVARALAAVTLFLAGAGEGARAEVVAVVAGIDDYEHVTKLGGALADAEDIAASFAWLGARTDLLLDRDATRPALLAALDRAIASTGPDDVLVFSFAGHGIQVPDLNGDEADGFDEAYVMPGYRPEKEDRDNLILDDEVERFIAAAAPRTVILLADSCHSGTMLRGVDRRSGFQRMRFVPRSSFDGPTRVTSPARAAAERTTLAASGNLIFFGAVPENIGVQEVLIDGRPRGALSYAFARALQGQADRNRDGVVTIAELTSQIPESVRAISDNRQTPQVVAGTAGRGFAIDLPEAAPMTANAEDREEAQGGAGQPASGGPAVPATATSDDGIVLIASSGGSDALWSLRGVEVVPPADADLILHAPSGDLLTGQGDIAARLGPARERQLLQGIVEKWRLLQGLQRGVDGGIQARVLPEDGVFTDGSPFTIRITTRDAGHLVLFDLASDGSLLTLYPTQDRPAPRLEAGETRDIPLRAGPPFGGDHLIAVVVPADRLTGLGDLLQRVHGRPPSLEQVSELKRLLVPYGPLPIAVYTAP